MNDKTQLIIHGIITSTGLASIAFRGEVGWNLAQLGAAMWLASCCYKGVLWLVRIEASEKAKEEVS